MGPRDQCTRLHPLLSVLQNGFQGHSSKHMFSVAAAAVDIIGIVVGHVYWFLADIVPKIIGRDVLKTPGFVYVSAPIVFALCIDARGALEPVWRQPRSPPKGLPVSCSAKRKDSICSCVVCHNVALAENGWWWCFPSITYSN